MRKTNAFRIAASTLVIGSVTVGCAPAGPQRLASLSDSSPKAEKDANKAYERAGVSLRSGKTDEAVTYAERAVELSGRDFGYRMVLGDLYLKSGRFLSAEQAFSDALVLNPSDSRAAMSRALAQIAQGKTLVALQALDRLQGVASVTDLGLAYALAGQPARAISMLEPAARAPEADGRLRQNLALSYALAGDWQKARVTAAQDVSPADLAGRLQQWAALAQPQAPHSQVAALLGVTPASADAGQPTQLALLPEAPVVAEAAPVVVAPVAVAPVSPKQVLAEAVAIDKPVADAAITEAKFAKAAETLVKPEPVRARNAVAATAPLPTFKPAQQRVSFEPVRAKKAASGGFVVQIGAYRNQLQAEKAWAQAEKRYSITGHEPLSTTVAIPGRGKFYRLSVSGFGTAAEAGRMCRSIKARGGACFVRTSVGDSAVQWASRRSGPRG